MGTIKINGNDEEFIELFQDQINEQPIIKESPNPEFKIDADLLETQDLPKPKLIKNLE